MPTIELQGKRYSFPDEASARSFLTAAKGSSSTTAESQPIENRGLQQRLRDFAVSPFQTGANDLAFAVRQGLKPSEAGYVAKKVLSDGTMGVSGFSMGNPLAAGVEQGSKYANQIQNIPKLATLDNAKKLAMYLADKGVVGAAVDSGITSSTAADTTPITDYSGQNVSRGARFLGSRLGEVASLLPITEMGMVAGKAGKAALAGIPTATDAIAAKQAIEAEQMAKQAALDKASGLYTKQERTLADYVTNRERKNTDLFNSAQQNVDALKNNGVLNIESEKRKLGLKVADSRDSLGIQKSNLQQYFADQKAGMNEGLKQSLSDLEEQLLAKSENAAKNVKPVGASYISKFSEAYGKDLQNILTQDAEKLSLDPQRLHDMLLERMRANGFTQDALQLGKTASESKAQALLGKLKEMLPQESANKPTDSVMGIVNSTSTTPAKNISGKELVNIVSDLRDTLKNKKSYTRSDNVLSGLMSDINTELSSQSPDLQKLRSTWGPHAEFRDWLVNDIGIFDKGTNTGTKTIQRVLMASPRSLNVDDARLFNDMKAKLAEFSPDGKPLTADAERIAQEMVQRKDSVKQSLSELDARRQEIMGAIAEQERQLAQHERYNLNSLDRQSRETKSFFDTRKDFISSTQEQRSRQLSDKATQIKRGIADRRSAKMTEIKHSYDERINELQAQLEDINSVKRRVMGVLNTVRNAGVGYGVYRIQSSLMDKLVGRKD